MGRFLRAISWVAVFAAVSGSAYRAYSEETVEDTVVAEEADSKPGQATTADSPGNAKDAASAADGASASSKSKYAAVDPAIELFDPRTYRLKVVIRIDCPDGEVKNVVATGPIPMDWPEQRVRLISQKISPQARASEFFLKGQAALLKFQVPQIPKGGSAFVERLYEITRYRTKLAIPGDELRLSRSLPAELKDQYAGIAPGVEIKDPKMIELARTLRKTNEQDGPWEMIKGFWSWTRDNVKFENGDFRGALYAIENRCGDCEEMSALFVGLCRLSGVSARSVWVEGHDYPEFYLIDKQGKGHWIPAQVVGPPWFGEITEYRPIFQKGDRFFDPLQQKYVRYVPHTVKGADGKATPKVDFRHEIIADSDINGPSYSNAK
jgi:transglutaminase-like putative cysteine protease